MKKIKTAQNAWRKFFHKFFPFLSDLIEENVKNRCVFPLVILGVYIVLVFIILNTITKVLASLESVFIFLKDR